MFYELRRGKRLASSTAGTARRLWTNVRQVVRFCWLVQLLHTKLHTAMAARSTGCVA